MEMLDHEFNGWLRSAFITLVVYFLTAPLTVAEVGLRVQHTHAFKKCAGELVFRDREIEYITKQIKHARVWNHVDIQQLGLMDSKTISIVTYEDSRKELGRDRRFHFVLTEGSIPESLLSYLQTRVTKPLVTGMLPTTLQTKYKIPAKHQHAWGGCQGVLKIGEEYVACQTSNTE